MEEKYRHLVVDGYDFDFNGYISKGWDLFKKGAGSLIGFILLYFLISIVINFIPFVNILGSFVQQTLIAGIFIFLRQLLRKKEEFGNFFGGFQYFGNIIVYILILLVIMIPIFALVFGLLIPFELLPELFDANPGDMEYLMEDLALSFAARLPFLFIVFIMAIYIGISYSMVLPLIVDAQLSPWKAMETSRRVVGKKFFSFLGFYFVIGIVASIGILITCGLGILVVMPVVYCIIFVAYDSILQPHFDTGADEIEEFGQSSEDVNTESEES